MAEACASSAELEQVHGASASTFPSSVASPKRQNFRDRERDLRGETAAVERKEEEDLGFERGAAGLVLWRGKEGAGPSWRWRRAPRSSALSAWKDDDDVVVTGGSWAVEVGCDAGLR